MTIDDLVLHPSTRRLVKKLSSTLPQGLIIDGPVGSGVMAVARALAKHAGSPEFIIYAKKNVKGVPVVDLNDGKVIIDDIRLLYEQTRTKQPGEHVYIIDTGAKSMMTGAQNAFLKLLEEPRKGVHFIIATHQFDQLLPTVVSRCQRLTLLPITDEQTNEFIDKLGINDQTKKTRLAFVGRGRPALIDHLANDPDAYDARVKIMGDAKTLLGQDTYKKILVINAYRNSRADALTLIDDMNHQLQIIIRSQPSLDIARTIDKNLDTRQHIAAGGNIRMQLLGNVL